MLSTTFGDTCLDDLGMVVERVHETPPEARVTTEEVPGMDGVAVTGVTVGQRDITLECRAFRDSWEDFDDLMSTLANMVGTIGRLSLRTHPGEWYDAILVSVTDGDRVGGSGVGYIELVFMAADPTRRSHTKSATVPSSGSVTFMVGGTRPICPSVIADAAVRDESSGVWGVRFDEGDFLHVALSSSTARAISIDADTRAVLVAGATSMVTLDSDWPSLEPGPHTARVDVGSGGCTIRWTERHM